MDSLTEFDFDAEMMVREKDVRKMRNLGQRIMALEERVAALEAERQERKTTSIANAEAMVERAFAPVEVREGPHGEMPVYNDEPEHGRIIRRKK